MERFETPVQTESKENGPGKIDILELRKFEIPEHYIDEGGAGKVYSWKEDGICMKVLEPRHNSTHAHLMNLGNTVDEEARIQGLMSGFQAKGKTRTPSYIAHMTSNRPDKSSIIVMEYLPAVNLQHILNKKEKLPDNFDVEKFFDDLESFIIDMHDKKNIAHGDLEPRNVMVDIETGTPYLIDFGRSIDTSKVTPEIRERLEMADLDKLNDMAEMLSKLTK